MHRQPEAEYRRRRMKYLFNMPYISNTRQTDKVRHAQAQTALSCPSKCHRRHAHREDKTPSRIR